MNVWPRVALSAGVLLLVTWVAATDPLPSSAADHSDTPLLTAIGRHDARLTDLYAFTNGDKIVFILCTNPAIPSSVSEYIFPSDLTLRFHIDNHSQVLFDNEADLIQFGGTIVRPQKVAEDILLEVTFDDDGEPRLHSKGLPQKFKHQILLYTGLRDDPFIRKPRSGRNVAAVVVELPLDAVIDLQPTLLIWATSKVSDIHGPICEHAGRALRSMFLLDTNTLRPCDHWKKLGVTPDVMIFDVSKPASFPNGRDLVDDVVDQVVDLPDGELPGEDPEFPTENDLPFLEDFPYLALPHLSLP